VATRGSASERPTVMLDEAAAEQSTRRLERRTTSPTPEFHDTPRQQFTVGRKRWAPVILIGVVVLIAMCTLAWAAFVRQKSHVTGDAVLIYPGSQTVVDTTTADGRAIQLRTPDSLAKVVAWYTAKLKPAKTMQLTQSTVVMKNGNVTVTLSVEDNTTYILIKDVVQ
jgi:hypothetical protein